jgi:acyl-CoA synthetase (AMP-forming)/AMP-acid ligase II
MQDWLAAAARERPDHPALVAEGMVATYAQLDERAARLAEEIEPGRVMPVGARYGIEFAALLHATWRAGGVAVPLEPGAEAPAGLDPRSGSALVILTSGTTGEPLPVALTLANLEASARASADAFPLTPGDRWLCPLPLTRIAGR